MGEAKRLTVYPFQAHDVPFVRYFEAFRKDFVLAHICAAPGSGLIGRDYGYAYNHESLGRTVEEDVEKAMADSDALLILSDGGLRKQVYAFMQQALSDGKEVFCYAALNRDEQEALSAIAQGRFHWEYGQELKSCISSRFQYMYKPMAPVLFAGGIANDMDQREILLGMAAELRSRGMAVSGVTYSPSDEFLGFHTYTELLQIDAVKGIKALNQLIKQIEQREYPDIILIELPGTMLRFNDMAVGDFGEYAYRFSQAVQADICICSVFSSLFSRELGEGLSLEFERRYNLPVDVFHLSNCLMDSECTLKRRELSLLRIAHEPVAANAAELRQETELPCYDLTTESELKACTDYIIEKFS